MDRIIKAGELLCLWWGRHLAHGSLGRQAKLDVQLMCELHSKLQQADIKELQLAVEGQSVPVDVPSVHSSFKGLHYSLL